MYNKTGKALQAANEMVALSKTAKHYTSDQRRELLWEAATIYNANKRKKTAKKILTTYIKNYPRPLEQSIEARQMLAAVDLIQTAFVGLVADVSDLPEAGLTAKDICSQLRELGIDASLRDSVTDVLDRCDAARYGSSHQDPGLLDEAQQALEALIQALKAQKRFR